MHFYWLAVSTRQAAKRPLRRRTFQNAEKLDYLYVLQLTQTTTRTHKATLCKR